MLGDDVRLRGTDDSGLGILGSTHFGEVSLGLQYLDGLIPSCYEIDNKYFVIEALLSIIGLEGGIGLSNKAPPGEAIKNEVRKF